MGFIDKEGKWVIKPQFEYAEKFSEGLALVKQQEKTGYINHDGELQVPLLLGMGEAFTNSLARVSQKNKSGYITKIGQWVWTEAREQPEY